MSFTTQRLQAGLAALPINPARINKTPSNSLVQLAACNSPAAPQRLVPSGSRLWFESLEAGNGIASMQWIQDWALAAESLKKRWLQR